ncbi:MAG: sugar transferase, partial [Solirubrobacteraceae bacterium]
MSHQPLSIDVALDPSILEASMWPTDLGRHRAPTRSGKRAFDVVFAGLLLCALLPALALVALAIKLDSRGPVFYRVRRTGYRGRPLLMLKVRKMHDGAKGGPLTVGGDPRLTRIGALLTLTRVDELPQLW